MTYRAAPTWHVETYGIAGRVPHRTAESEAAVRSLEQRLNTPIPASLREVLVTDQWPQFLRDFSNCDEPLDIAEMGVDTGRWRSFDPSSALLLPFMVENQGVCTWAIPLNEGDDPYVLVEVDGQDPPIWKTAAESFSMWLRCQVEDQLVLAQATLGGQAGPLSDEVRSALLRIFSAAPSTSAWPAREILRFRNDLGALLLWNDEEQCDWWVAPASERATDAMLGLLSFAPEVVSTLRRLGVGAKLIPHTGRLAAKR